MSKQGKSLSSNVGKLLADRRNELKMTQAEVSSFLRIQRTSLSNIESGKQVLLMDVFYDICERLSMDPVATLDEAIKSMAGDTMILKEIDNFVASVDIKK